MRDLLLALLLVLPASACQRGPVAAGSAAAISALEPVSPKPSSEPERAPEPERATAESLVSLASYPDPLVPEPVELPKSGPLFQGHVLWARSFRSRADRSSPFFVALCKGPCRFTLLEKPGAFKSADLPLDGERQLAIRFVGMFLGGALGVVQWPSPSGRFEVVAFTEIPLHDVEISAAARAYYHDHDLVAALEAVGKGWDRALFPSAPAR